MCLSPSVVGFLSSHSFNSLDSSLLDRSHASVVTAFGSDSGLLQVDTFQFSSLDKGESFLQDSLRSAFSLSSGKFDSFLPLHPGLGPEVTLDGASLGDLNSLTLESRISLSFEQALSCKSDILLLDSEGSSLVRGHSAVN